MKLISLHKVNANNRYFLDRSSPGPVHTPHSRTWIGGPVKSQDWTVLDPTRTEPSGLFPGIQDVVTEEGTSHPDTKQGQQIASVRYSRLS